MNPYIQFNVTGMKGISISEESHSFSVLNHGNIVSIEFVLDDLDIVGIKVYFSQETLLDTELIYSTTRLVELFLTNIIGELDVIVDGFSLKVNQVYSPNKPIQDGPIILRSTIGISDSVSVTCSYPIDRYQQLFSEIPTTEEVIDKLLVFGNIMKIDNIAVRYLMQYEFLLSLVSPTRRQKDITDYIRNRYNSSLSFDFIGFHQTRRPGRDFEEDDISYYRNILAHNDSNDIPNDFETIVTHMSKAANRVIFYALKSDNK